MHDHHSHGHTHTIEIAEHDGGTAGGPTRPRSSSSPTATSSSSRSRRSRSRSGTRPCACSPTTARFPGPTLKVPQGSTITVHVTNHGDLDATVHWHGLRLENRYDGTHETQAPIPVGETFTYQVQRARSRRLLVPPAHPRGLRPGDGPLREHPRRPERATTTGRPPTASFSLTLDDVLIEDGRIAPFSESETTHVAMGRFGNVMLVAGEPELSLEAKRGEVVRFYFTNTANTRVFNVTLPGARMKLVGADSGHYEHEEFVEEVLLAPSERVVVDVLFAEPGELALEHRTPEKTYRLAAIDVVDEPAEPDLTGQFESLRTNEDMSALRERIEPFIEAPPDKTLSFVAEMDEVGPEGGSTRVSTPARCTPRSSPPGRASARSAG